MTARTRSDAELLVATAGEPEAFGTFYRRHVTAVLAYLIARTGRSDVAADVCAETFARALEQRQRCARGLLPARPEAPEQSERVRSRGSGS